MTYKIELVSPCKCGASAMLVDMQGDVNRVQVMCSGSCRPDVDQAIEVWNTRVAEEKSVLNIEGLKMALEHTGADYVEVKMEPEGYIVNIKLEKAND